MKLIWLLIFISVFIWSAIDPKDYFTWFLEVLPAIIGLILLAITEKSFPLTPLLYTLILIHCIILMVGGHFTYAEVPLFDTLKDVFNWNRNNYDKVGHFAQGFVPAIITREILIRKNIIAFDSWRNFIIISICLAVSAFYELIEWLVAISSDQAAEAFLGTQGYVWDTQTDMFMALIGAVVALMTLSKTHNEQLEKLPIKHKGLSS